VPCKTQIIRNFNPTSVAVDWNCFIQNTLGGKHPHGLIKAGKSDIQKLVRQDLPSNKDTRFSIWQYIELWFTSRLSTKWVYEFQFKNRITSTNDYEKF